MTTAVDELMQHFKQIGLQKSPMMDEFYNFHLGHPELLNFLLQELVTLKENHWPTTSFEMLWHHARWVLTYRNRVPGETFKLRQNLMPHYSRIVIILFPEFNGFYRVGKAKADGDFGLRKARRLGKGLRRLEWADGTPLESGWRPSTPYVIPVVPVPRRPPVQRVQAILLEGAAQ